MPRFHQSPQSAHTDSHRAATRRDDNSLFAPLPWCLSGAPFLASLEWPRKHLSRWPTQFKEQLIFTFTEVTT